MTPNLSQCKCGHLRSVHTRQATIVLILRTETVENACNECGCDEFLLPDTPELRRLVAKSLAEILR